MVAARPVAIGYEELESVTWQRRMWRRPIATAARRSTPTTPDRSGRRRSRCVSFYDQRSLPLRIRAFGRAVNGVTDQKVVVQNFYN